MDYKYTVFNPNASGVARELLTTPDKDLVKKYIKRKHKNSMKFFDSVRLEINKLDDEEFLVNPFMYSIEGSNLNYIATQVYVQASKLNQLGFEFRVDRIVRDLDRLLSEKSAEVDKINKDSKIQPLARDIAHFFTSEIISDKVIRALEDSLNNKNSFAD